MGAREEVGVRRAFACPQVLRMRAGMFQHYRERHAARIRLDLSGHTSIEVSFTIRLSWATQEWVGAMTELRDMFFDVEKMHRWGVLKRRAAGLDEAEATAASAADPHMLAVFESMARAFWGLHARGLSLWLGGIYSMVKLCSLLPRQRDESISRGCALWDGLAVLEMMVAASEADPELLEFWHGFLWPKSVVYRELLVLLSEGRLEEAVAYAWRVHSSTPHEKGPFSIVGSKYSGDLSIGNCYTP